MSNVAQCCIGEQTNRIKSTNQTTLRGLSSLSAKSAMWRLENDFGGGGFSRTLRLYRMRADSIPASLFFSGQMTATCSPRIDRKGSRNSVE